MQSVPFKPTRRAFLALAALVGVIAAAPFGTAIPAAAETPKWVIPVAEAKALISGGAVVLDVRGQALKDETPLANAVSVEWPYFTKDDKAQKGQLLDDDAELTKRIQALGVSADVPVVVVADAVKGWGEDGRIVWTLRTLGHTQAFFVDGGIAALIKDGDPGIKAVAGNGTFEVKRVADFEVKKEDLRQLLGSTNVVILDTREPREYAGETPYGESRGGHVPGAKHVFYKDFLDANGDVLPPDQIRAKLAALGASPDAEVISYCTGGIRSGFVTAVLNNAGIKAKNYAGSMWDWSSADATEYPLVTGTN
ncbi:MAG: rhodanese-like domain-containing protein [Cyanobacteriota bacterium]|nr:rhodanese-like domain-containing protein [Cyanobacteriota bacterium]